MKIIFFINFLISLSIFILLSLSFFKHYGNKKISKIIHYLSIIGLFYFVIAVLSSLWFFDILIYNSQDFLLIYSIIIIMQSLILFKVIYLFLLNKNLLYFLFLYLITFLSFFSSIINFLHLFLITSFLLMLVIFIYLSSRDDIYRKIGYLGILYSSLSLIFQILLLIGIGEIYFFSLFSNFIFLMLIFNLLNDLKKYPLTHLEFSKHMKKSYFLAVFRPFIFILILTNFIFIGTISIHELGHFGISKFYDCEYRRIVYEGSFPHTDILCKSLPDNFWVLLGGILLPLVLALALFIIGGEFIRDISLLIMGFNLIASNRDFLDLGISDNLIMASLFFGVLFLIIGIVMLAKSKVERHIHSLNF